jgi:hypothetical protein
MLSRQSLHSRYFISKVLKRLVLAYIAPTLVKVIDLYNQSVAAIDRSKVQILKTLLICGYYLAFIEA